MPGKSGSVTSPVPSSSESVVARVYLSTDDCHRTTQFKGIIVCSPVLHVYNCDMFTLDNAFVFFITVMRLF